MPKKNQGPNSSANSHEWSNQFSTSTNFIQAKNKKRSPQRAWLEMPGPHLPLRQSRLLADVLQRQLPPARAPAAPAAAAACSADAGEQRTAAAGQGLESGQLRHGEPTATWLMERPLENHGQLSVLLYIWKYSYIFGKTYVRTYVHVCVYIPIIIYIYIYTHIHIHIVSMWWHFHCQVR